MTTDLQLTEQLSFGFPAQFVYELALGDLPPKDVCEAYGISKARFKELLDNPVFVVMYQKIRDEMLERGMSLKTKALIITENGLSMVHGLINNPEANPGVRMDAMKLAAQLAGVGQKGPAAEGPTGTGFNISIVFGGGQQALAGGRVIEHING